MNKQLVVATTSWQSLIESLKANAVHGYKSLDSVSYDGVFYKAVLQQTKDTAYLEALQKLSGEEKDGDPSKDSFLSVRRAIEASESVKPIVIRPTPSGSEVKELFDQFVEPLVEAVDTSNIQIKVKRQPRSKK
jgi:hypothetical protein